MAVLFEPAELAVIGDVTPDEVAAGAVPGGAFGPAAAEVEAFDGGVVVLEFGEAGIERDDVGVGIADGVAAGPIALRLRGGRRRRKGSGGVQEVAAGHFETISKGSAIRD